MTPEALKNEVCRLLDSKKAADICVLDVAELTTVADYFVVAGGTSTTNVRALAEYVEEQLELLDVRPLRKEGVKDARWAVYDYGSVVMHILLDDMRLFYCLEKLWSDGKNITKYQAPAEPLRDESKKKSASKKTSTQAEEAVEKAHTAKKKPAQKVASPKTAVAKAKTASAKTKVTAERAKTTTPRVKAAAPRAKSAVGTKKTVTPKKPSR